MSMKIGELANTAGVTTKTIRYYESIGVLGEPARSESGYRSYGPAAIERLDFVKQAQSSGLALAEIRSILEIKDQGGQTCEHTTSLLRWHLDELDAKIVELQPPGSNCKRCTSVPVRSTQPSAPTRTAARSSLPSNRS